MNLVKKTTTFSPVNLDGYNSRIISYSFWTLLRNQIFWRNLLRQWNAADGEESGSPNTWAYPINILVGNNNCESYYALCQPWWSFNHISNQMNSQVMERDSQ